MTAWRKSLPTRAQSSSPGAQLRFLAAGIQALHRARGRGLVPSSALALEGQPFDRELLDASALFRRSRKAYRGRFIPSYVSSPRTLASPALLEPFIEYSPIERELFWAAEESPKRLLELRTVATSLFHEQNHRLLWALLPRARPSSLRSLLNLAESLVIALDMALGDELGPELAPFFYAAGVTYDPGTSVRAELSNRRAYRNYLQAAVHATYLNLELFEPRDIPRAISALFPGLGPFAARAARRAANLDPGFIRKTNLRWQRRHRIELERRLCAKKKGLVFPDDPLDNREAYLLGEKWFAAFGL